MNVEETEADALPRIAGENVELLAEVSRLGQQLQEARDSLASWQEMAGGYNREMARQAQRAVDAEAERDGLRQQLAAVEALAAEWYAERAEGDFGAASRLCADEVRAAILREA